jgi:ribonucleoside-diphosphate reductase beta chain
MSFSVFEKTSTPKTQAKLFFDESVGIARYDQPKYPWIQKLTDKQLGFFWRPEEIDCTKDGRDFKQLTEHEKHIFTSNLKRQILLDSVQGRAPSVSFLSICSNPELEIWMQSWAFSETIHSQSYTHIIRNVYANPTEVFDQMLDIQEIVDCAKDVSEQYDALINYNNAVSIFGYKTYPQDLDQYEHKKLLWKTLMSVNILEGIRFYVSFACSWAFAENKKMEGNAKIIKFICRDENLHLAGTQHLLKTLPKDDPDFVTIKEETKDECVALFQSAIDQEKDWAKYLFKDGSMIGLNENLLLDYVDYIATKRMAAVDLGGLYKQTSNPLPWTEKWIAGSEVQQAPQEVAIASYVIGGIDKDVDDDTFKGFKL